MRRMRATVSVASSSALVDTSKGCTTCSSKMFEMMPCARCQQSPSTSDGAMNHLLDVDAGVGVTEGVLVPQLGDDGDGVQTGVLGKSGGDDLERLGECLEAVRLLALERLGVLRE